MNFSNSHELLEKLYALNSDVANGGYYNNSAFVAAHEEEETEELAVAA
jgi:hypothetical protein